jgi:hypothetical protein
MNERLEALFETMKVQIDINCETAKALEGLHELSEEHRKLIVKMGEQILFLGDELIKTRRELNEIKLKLQ